MPIIWTLRKGFLGLWTTPIVNTLSIRDPKGMIRSKKKGCNMNRVEIKDLFSERECASIFFISQAESWHAISNIHHPHCYDLPCIQAIQSFMNGLVTHNIVFPPPERLSWAFFLLLSSPLYLFFRPSNICFPLTGFLFSSYFLLFSSHIFSLSPAWYFLHPFFLFFATSFSFIPHSSFSLLFSC